jgi:hypothetical protein
MQAQLDKDRKLTQPKAPEEFTPDDFIDYYKQTQSFGVDDLARNIPIVGGLLARQDSFVRARAEKILTEGTESLTESQFNAMRDLLNTPPQQSFLGSIFGQQEYKAPDILKGLTYKNYQNKQSGSAIESFFGTDDLQAEKDLAEKSRDLKEPNTEADLANVPTNTILSPDNATNIIRDMGKNMPFKGTMSENISKAMLGIRQKEIIDPDTKEKRIAAVVSTPKTRDNPEGEKELDAGTMQSFVKNAKGIQDTVLKRTTDIGGGDSGRPAGSGPPSVQEIFNELHGFDKGGLAAKPKPKPKRKRTTKKGLGVKTKAT